MGTLLAFLEKNRSSLLHSMAALLLVCFALLSYYCYWSDSEIWGITLARQFGEIDSYNVSVFFKLPFYGMLRLLYEIPGKNAALLDSARLLFCCIGIANAALAWRLALNLSGSRVAASLAFVLLLGNTIYVNQGFRVRSDILAAFWHLVTMNLLVGLRRQAPSAGGWRGTLTLFALNTMMLAATPKAIYFTLSQLVFAFVWGRGAEPETRRNYYRSVGLAFLSPVVAGILFLVVSRIFSLQGGSNRIFVGYWTAWVYFRDALSVWEPFNFDSERLYFVKRFVERNPDLILLFAGAIFLAPLSAAARARRGSPAAALAAYGVMLLAAASTYNDFLPFFLASLLPVLCVSAALALHEFAGSPEQEDEEAHAADPLLARLRRASAVVIAIAAALKGIAFCAVNLNGNNNFGQRAAIKVLEEIRRNYPRAEVYDVIGTMPRSNRIYKFVGPGQAYSNGLVMEFLESRKPEVIPFIRKLGLLEPRISALLETEYADLGYGIYGRAAVLDLANAEIVQLPTGKYRKVAAGNLEERLRALSFGAAHEHVYFHLWQINKTAREGSERVLSLGSGSADPVNLGSGPVPLTKLSGIRFLFVPVDAVSAAVTYFSPVDLPIPAEHSVFFLFSFDSLY